MLSANPIAGDGRLLFFTYLSVLGFGLTKRHFDQWCTLLSDSLPDHLVSQQKIEPDSVVPGSDFVWMSVHDPALSGRNLVGPRNYHASRSVDAKKRTNLPHHDVCAVPCRWGLQHAVFLHSIKARTIPDYLS